MVRNTDLFIGVCNRQTDRSIPSPTEHAFAAKHLADLGQEEADFGVFHWEIRNWAALEKRITGPEFECGGHRW
jgi:ubiquitin carboxyl-terminal hydrolase 7